jgi:hypothetical protein
MKNFMKIGPVVTEMWAFKNGQPRPVWDKIPKFGGHYLQNHWSDRSKICKTQKKRNEPVSDRNHEVLGMHSFGEYTQQTIQELSWPTTSYNLHGLSTEQ